MVLNSTVGKQQQKKEDHKMTIIRMRNAKEKIYIHLAQLVGHGNHGEG